MKNKDLKIKLKELKWFYLRNGHDHEIWTNGKYIQPIPFKRELNFFLAKKIIKNCINYNKGVNK